MNKNKVIIFFWDTNFYINLMNDKPNSRPKDEAIRYVSDISPIATFMKPKWMVM